MTFNLNTVKMRNLTQFHITWKLGKFYNIVLKTTFCFPNMLSVKYTVMFEIRKDTKASQNFLLPFTLQFFLEFALLGRGLNKLKFKSWYFSKLMWYRTSDTSHAFISHYICSLYPSYRSKKGNHFFFLLMPILNMWGTWSAPSCTSSPKFQLLN